MAWSEASRADAGTTWRLALPAERVHAFPAQYPRRRAWLSAEIVGAALAAVDFGLVVAAGALAYLTYFGATGEAAPRAMRYMLAAMCAAAVFVAVFERSGGYRLKRLRRRQWQLVYVSTIWAATVSVLLLAGFVGKFSDSYSRGWALAWIGLSAALLLIGRAVCEPVLVRCVKAGYLTRNVAIVGAGDEGRRLIAKLQGSQDPEFRICALFDDRKSRLPPAVRGLTILGTTTDLLRFARSNPVDEVIVALPLEARSRLVEIFDKLKGLAVDVRLSCEPLAEMFEIRGMNRLGEVPILEIADRPLKNWNAIVKWLEDRVLGLSLFIFFAPIMAIVAFLIKIESRGPALFVQDRFGFNNQPIRVFKFRTMHVDRGDCSGAERTVRNDPRVTRLGRVLRFLSLDELPQLINVLRGEMSLVGPRPHAIAMKAGNRLYGDAVKQYSHRHRVKPGITGWAQVNGSRGEVDTLEKAQERVEYDLYYIDHWTPLLDIKIMLMTAGILVVPDNVY